MRKPSEVFDRDHEWSALASFVTDDQPGATLGVVSGRRRQGKTFLLEAACWVADGFYFGATEASGRGVAALASADGARGVDLAPP